LSADGGRVREIIRRNREAYRRIAGEWERRRETDYDGEFHLRCRALFLRHLAGVRVLDAGCGLGLDSLAFAQAGLSVTAADLVEEFLTLARGRAPGIRVAAMDLTAPCFREESFDGIFACASFLHVPREAAAETLAALARLLAPGGVLFLHHVESAAGLDGYRVEGLLVDDNPAECFCHAEAELATVLACAGLRVVEFCRIAPAKPPSACARQHQLAPYQVVARRPQPAWRTAAMSMTKR
jgi:2-polyprenyl-3-methyl-5-hydroxy-6-metoxy-1,4-benzoquinol methylase